MFSWIVDNSTTVTKMFGFVIFGWLVISLISSFLKFNIGHKSTYSILGMLGTFVGITAGLCEFDSAKMDESVIHLIDGLKTAFFTSIMGIFASLLHSGIHDLIQRYHNKQDDNKQQYDNEILTLNAIMDNTNSIAIGIEKLTLAINSESESSSVLGQIKLLRNDTNDGFNKLDKTLQKFAEEISKSSTETIVQALQEVINSFNEKITDQLGENFKSLGNAVEKLVVWQNEYKEYLESFKNNLELANQAVKSNTENVEILSNHIKDIKEHTLVLPENLQAVEKIITIQKEELQKLYDVLGSFTEMRDKAIQAMPEIKDQVSKLTNKLEETVTDAINQNEEHKQNLINSFEETSISLENKMREVFEGFEKSDELMHKAIQKVIETMGNELATLSQYLVNDYKELNNAIKETVQSVKRT